jgi:hypothetical protein
MSLKRDRPRLVEERKNVPLSVVTKESSLIPSGLVNRVSTRKINLPALSWIS